MSISVIIPTLNEATYIANTLRSVCAEKPQKILVVDGGSNDATWPIVSSTLAQLPVCAGQD